jgi:hypothetical protein
MRERPTGEGKVSAINEEIYNAQSDHIGDTLVGSDLARPDDGEDF